MFHPGHDIRFTPISLVKLKFLHKVVKNQTHISLGTQPSPKVTYLLQLLTIDTLQQVGGIRWRCRQTEKLHVQAKNMGYDTHFFSIPYVKLKFLHEVIKNQTHISLGTQASPKVTYLLQLLTIDTLQ